MIRLIKNPFGLFIQKLLNCMTLRVINVNSIVVTGFHQYFPHRGKSEGPKQCLKMSKAERDLKNP